MRKKIISSTIGIALVVGAILVMLFLIKNKKTPDKDSSKHSILYVKVKPVEIKQQRVETVYNGKIGSYEEIFVTPEVSGKMLPTQIPVKEGTKFKKGDLLVNIYDEDFLANLYSQRSSFLYKLSSVLPDLEMDFAPEYPKWETFFNKIDIKKDLPDLPEITNSKEQIFLSSKQIISSYYNIKRNEITASKYKIYAPFSGSYKTVFKQSGSVAAAGQNIASIIRTDFLEIVVPVSGEVAKHLSPNQSVTILDKTNQQSQGKVLRISDFLDKTTQMVKVFVKYVPEGDNKLLAGEFVEVFFDSQKDIVGMRLPREAVFKNNKVYLFKNKELVEKSVSLEFVMDDYVIVGGLEARDTVVVESLVDVAKETVVRALL